MTNTCINFTDFYHIVSMLKILNNILKVRMETITIRVAMCTSIIMFGSGVSKNQVYY